MQLSKIKISGFKSFVDPTTVLLPSNLVAIVGPNGCGKSNIIDAVCWVMGESSAKYLRGESLTDVIFNGSSARKPVGQASVELIFDNQDGAIGGEYASYAEVSIRRVINRDSESTYFLNGTKCRRRDIIDIFLGTGLGPRSYSIIGQNMISRLIEAKPDDMRIYLEEAAGISKYKERRRETENRIGHTKENLARLDDVRNELDKQLGTLKRQANAAERYKELKQEERISRGKWLAAQWRQYDSHLVQYTLQIQQQETSLEAKQTELGNLNLNLDKKRDEHRLATEMFQEVQRRFYSAGNDITRVEQDIHHTEERKRQWEADVKQVEFDWTNAKNNLDEMECDLANLTQEIQELTPQLSEASAEARATTAEHEQFDEAMQDWQIQWDEFNTHAAQTTQTAQVEQTRITHLEQRLSSIKQRKLKIEEEQRQIDFTQLQQEIEIASEQIAQFSEMNEGQHQQLTQVRKEISELQNKQQQDTEQLDQVRSHLQRLRGEQSSLEALQQTALGQRDNPVTAWLAQHNLDKQPRLAQNLEVEAGWELAVEKALGNNLQAVCVDSISAVADAVNDIQQGSLCVFAGGANAAHADAKRTRLQDKIKSTLPLDSLLSGIYIAETQEEALALCPSLDVTESVITRDGVWLSPAWLRISRDENPAAGVFQREQTLKQIARQIEELTEQQHILEDALNLCRDRLRELEDQCDDLQQAHNQMHSQIAQLQAQHKMKESRMTDLQERAERNRREQEESSEQYEQTQEELAQARSVWQKAMTELQDLADQRERLTAERDQVRERLHTARDRADEAKELAHQLEIRMQTTKSQQASMQQAVMRMQTHLSTLEERKNTLQNSANFAEPLLELQKTLAVALENRLHIEEELNSARSTIQSIDHDLREMESRRQVVEHEIAKVRDMLETLRLEGQSLKVKNENILEQMNEAQIQMEPILQELTDDVSVDELHQQFDAITNRITRLGPINLVAIEEYASCSERKTYLDTQYADLQEGLATLENAIAKIDKETRARFQETFDKVNNRFQELFPQIFGGGRAYMDLTGDNLLDAGVTVMACPPGKRNSTIHLLSGGEKAMTAIALVFSIFHLNPAPFCLLDEVDAPLDDANIGRFCQLVKTMSDKTQFIFISHNKLAIEMGEHLMGVTMHEPGVSRLVSVNVEEAVSLAGA